MVGAYLLQIQGIVGDFAEIKQQAIKAQVNISLEVGHHSKLVSNTTPKTSSKRQRANSQKAQNMSIIELNQIL